MNLTVQNRKHTKAVDEQFAQREETYKAWCDEIAELTLKQLKQVLEQAEKELEELEKTVGLLIKSLQPVPKSQQLKRVSRKHRQRMMSVRVNVQSKSGKTYTRRFKNANGSLRVSAIRLEAWRAKSFQRLVVL